MTRKAAWTVAVVYVCMSLTLVTLSVVCQSCNIELALLTAELPTMLRSHSGGILHGLAVADFHVRCTPRVRVQVCQPKASES